MKAAVLNKIGGRFEVEDLDIADPIGHEVLIDVKASGLCHSDLHMQHNNYGVPFPAVLGHEPAGIVRAVGPDVTDFTVGDRVVGSLIQACGHCANCRAGRPVQCLNQQELNRGRDEEPRLSRNGRPILQMYGLGAFAEQALVHENQLVAVPEAVPFPQAAVLGCAVITGAGAAINCARVSPGQTVAVVGLGGIGLNVVNGARLAGASRIIGIDTQPAKLELARRFGATDTVDPAHGNVVEAVRSLTGGGVDTSFDAVGSPEAIEEALGLARLGGTTYVIGMSAPTETVSVAPMPTFLGMQRTISGVFMGGSDIRRDIPSYCDLYLQGRFDLDDLISQQIDLDGIDEAYSQLGRTGIARSVITSF